MQQKKSKNRERIRLLTVYLMMISSIVVVASLVILFVLGYRFDRESKRFEQGSLIQFESKPSGALVSIDNQVLSSSTPTKLTALPGLSYLKMQKNGYETWSKTVVIKSGTLYWINYVRLVPKNKPLNIVKSYQQMSNSLYSPDGKQILVQETSKSYKFDIFDIRNDDVSIKTISLPDFIVSSFTQSSVSGYTLTPYSWDKNGRYVLLLRVDDKSEKVWILLDTKNPEQSKNISQILSIKLDKIEFSGTSGRVFYALSNGELRRLDLESNTISRPYYSNLVDFKMLNSSTLSFEATKTDSSGSYKQVGIFRDGDQTPHIISQVDAKMPILKIALSQFANDDYVAVLESNKLTIYKGDFPASDSLSNDSLVLYAEYLVADETFDIQFSPDGDYLVSRSSTTLDSYDIQYQQRSTFKSEADKSRGLNWLDSSHIYGISDNQLFIQEFDGTNLTKLNVAVDGFPASFNSSQKYIYLTSKQDSGIGIMRIQMIVN